MCILNKLEKTYPGGYWLNSLVEVTSVRNLRFSLLLSMNYLNPQHILKIQTVFSEIDQFISLLRVIIGVTSTVVAKLSNYINIKKCWCAFQKRKGYLFSFIFSPFFLPSFLPSFFLAMPILIKSSAFHVPK